MRRPRRPTNLAKATVLIAVVLIAWLALAPPQLGGRTSYVITHGNSMEPRVEEGDLVLLREGAYGKGDVVGYRSAALGQLVMHRIVQETSQGFVTQGDNNDWLDTDRPSSADVLGKEWIHIPGAGKWLAKARSPFVASLLIGSVALTFLIGNNQKARRKRKGRQPHVPKLDLASLPAPQKKSLATAGSSVLVFVMLAGIGFSQPVRSLVKADAAYKHEGVFDYRARVEPNPIYPTGTVEPGRPIFLKLVDRLNVSFAYALEAEAEHSVVGEAGLFAHITGATGWKRVVPLSPSKAFEGHRVTVEGVLDLEEIKQLSSEIQAVTGVAETSQTIEVKPRIDVRGDIAGQSFEGRFLPALAFDMDAYQLRNAAGEAEGSSGADAVGTPPLEYTEPGEVSVSDVRPHVLRLLGISIPVMLLRALALPGLIASCLVAAAMWFRFAKVAPADETSAIAAKYAEWLIPVERMPREVQANAVEVQSIEALIRLAEVYERMVLHHESRGVHAYYLEGDGVLYRYRAASNRAAASERTPATKPRPRRTAPPKQREELRKSEMAKLRQQLEGIEKKVMKGTAPTDKNP